MTTPPEAHIPETTPQELHELPPVVPVNQEISLVQFSPADGATLYALLERNPDFRNYVAWASKVSSEADVIPRIQSYSNIAMDGRYGIVSNDGLQGHVGIHRSGNDYDLSYGLDHDARGRGYVNLALSALIGIAYTKLHARSFVMQIQPENTASVRVAESLGAVAAEEVMGIDFPVSQKRWRLDGTALETLLKQ